MTKPTDPLRPRVRLLPTALLPLLLLSVWCLHDSQAYVQSPKGPGLFWANSEATIHLNLGSSSWNRAAEKALVQWNATGSRFRFWPGSRQVGPSCSRKDKINTVVWASTYCGKALGYKMLAVTYILHDRNIFGRETGEILDADVIFNDTKQWGHLFRSTAEQRGDGLRPDCPA